MIITTCPARNNVQRMETMLAVRKALFIGAHPDDIEWYCGALVYELRRRGTEVVFVIATKGGKGRRGKAKERLEAKRSSDQMKAVEILGGAMVLFLSYPDKGLIPNIDPLDRELRSIIASEKPDAVFSWDPDYIYNPHLDHRAVAESVWRAVWGYTSEYKTELPLYYYGTCEPDIWFGCSQEVFDIKLRSLRVHSTELVSRIYPLAKRILVKRMRTEGKKIGVDYAEIYRKKQ